MASLRHKLGYLLLTIILVLALSACVRPFGQGEAEQAELATQGASAEATVQTEEGIQAEEEVPVTGEETAEAEGEIVATEQVVTETVVAEEVTEGEEAATPESGAGVETPVAEEETPAAVEEAEAEETPSAEEAAEAVKAAEGEKLTGEEPAEEVTAGEVVVEEPTAEAAPTTGPEAAQPSQTTLPATHTVAPGENLFRIGLKYGLSWVPLAIYNNIPNANLIYTGQVIRIPGGQTPPTQSAPEGAAYTNYVVQQGDTVYKISRAFGVSPEEIVKANGLMNPNLIYAGQVLKIPTS